MAWLVPVVTHALGLDVLLPPLILAGLMAVQRHGSWLDRLVLALVQAFGAVCLAGLLISVWPWGLHPIPVAGLALSALALRSRVPLLTLFAVKGAPINTRPGRPRPGRPRPASRRPTSWRPATWRPTSWRPASRRGANRVIGSANRVVGGANRVVAGAAAGVAGLALVPFAVRDLGGRLGILIVGEDMSRHFLLYDLIGRLGGYPFLAPIAETAPYAPDEQIQGIRVYPQGLHFGYALLDRFVRAAPDNADPITAIDTLVWLCVATFGAVALAVLWSLRRMAGPGVDAARLLPVVVLGAVWLYFGDPVAVFVRGFPNQLAALGLVAVLTALVARPLPAPRQQVLSVALLLVGVSFTYHLYLPYAAAVTAWWVLTRRVYRSGFAWLVGAAIAVPVALTPMLNLYATTARQLTAAGTAYPVDRPATVLLVLLALGGLLLTGGLRAPARRTGLFALGTAVGLAALLAGYQVALIGQPIYYFDKLLHLVIVVGLVLLGGLARLLPVAVVPVAKQVAKVVPVAKPVPVAPSAGLLRRAAPGVAMVLPAAAALAAFGGQWHTGPGSHGLRLVVGVERGSPAGARDALLMTERFPDGGGAVNVGLMSTPYRNAHATFFGAALQRTYRYGHPWYGFLNPSGPPRSLADLEAMVQSSPVPVRLFVYNPRASMLVLDPARPNRQWRWEYGGAPPAEFGDPDAPTNIRAAEHLARRFPDKVTVVYAVPVNP